MPPSIGKPPASSPGLFDKLPKRFQLVLLILLMLVPAVIEFLMGMHSVHTGKPIILRNRWYTAVECFFWCAVFLAIAGGLFAVLMGWAKPLGKQRPKDPGDHVQ